MSHVIERADGGGAAAAGLVHGIDARVRLVVLAAFAIVVVALDDVWLVVAALGFAVGFATAARLPLLPTLRRVLVMDLFMVFILVMLPFTMPGEPLVTIGPLTATWGGLERAIGIALKANAIVLALLALVGSMEAVTLGHALHRLGLPEALVHLLLFTVRYVDVLHQEYARLRLAMTARAFRPRSDRHTWRTFGFLVGMLLVRSVERSERILQAMKCRGYTGHLHLLVSFQLSPDDLAFAGVCGAALAVLLGLEFA